MIFCPKCGEKQNSDNVKFCKKCGAPIKPKENAFAAPEMPQTEESSFDHSNTSFTASDPVCPKCGRTLTGGFCPNCDAPSAAAA